MDTPEILSYFFIALFFILFIANAIISFAWMIFIFFEWLEDRKNDTNKWGRLGKK